MSAKRKDLFNCPACQGSTTIKHIIKTDRLIVRNHWCEKCQIMHVVAYGNGKCALIDSYRPKKKINLEEVIL